MGGHQQGLLVVQRPAKWPGYLVDMFQPEGLPLAVLQAFTINCDSIEREADLIPTDGSKPFDKIAHASRAEPWANKASCPCCMKKWSIGRTYQDEIAADCGTGQLPINALGKAGGRVYDKETLACDGAGPDQDEHQTKPGTDASMHGRLPIGGSVHGAIRPIAWADQSWIARKKFRPGNRAFVSRRHRGTRRHRPTYCPL